MQRPAVFDIVFKAQNLNEQPVEVNGNYYLYPLEETNVKESSLKETGLRRQVRIPLQQEHLLLIRK